MGGKDNLITLMRRLELSGKPHGEVPEKRAEQASECGDPNAESCGRPAWGGGAVRSPAAIPSRGEDRFSPLCLLMNPILPGAVHPDLAGEKTENLNPPAGGRIPQPAQEPNTLEPSLRPVRRTGTQSS
jgi:hypothetical protein